MSARISLYGLLGFLLVATAVATDKQVDDHQYTDAELRQVLVEGNEMVSRGSPKSAIREKYDVVIDYYKKTYSDPSQQIFTARTQAEALYYSVLGAKLERDTLVLNSLWSDAYLMKGYALIDLGELSGAKDALEAAIALAPQNSQYLSELGYWYQANRDWETSLSKYESAAEAAEMIEDKELKVEEITRAWRGQGYALVEMGKLDEAEALYKKCLKLNKNDEKARGELQYVKEQQLALKRKP